MNTMTDARMHSLGALSASVAVAALAVFVAPEVTAQPGGGSSSSTTTSSPGVGGAGGVPGEMRLNIFGTLGFGGETDAEVEFDNPDFDDYDVDDLHMETTNGVGAQFDYALHRYFLLGGRLAFNFAEFDDDRYLDRDHDLDRFMLMNLDVVPKGRLPIAGAPIEFYAAVPIGMSFNFPDGSHEDDLVLPGDTDLGTGVSGNLSVHLGLHYWFNSTIGIMVEQGLYHQQYNFPGHTVVERGPLEDAESDVVVGGHFNQFSVNVGISIGL